MSVVTETLAESGPSIDSTRRVGTLYYTRAGLVTLFAWLLWGDFCFMLMEMVVPAIAPLQLKNLNAPNWAIALIMSTLPGVLNMTVCPWISFKSDRYRSRWGRRIPFILWSLPFLVFFLILMGFSSTIGKLVHSLIFSQSTVTVATVTICCIGLFMVGFQFFNMFVNSVFWYLFNDVVPMAFMGRFLGLFRLVSSINGVLFNYFIYRYAETHAPIIYTGIAIIYAIGFGLMCLRVREGEYPPPPERENHRDGFFAQVKTYFRECYSDRFYWTLFLYTACWAIMLTINVFGIFMNRSIGLDLAQIGRISAACAVLNMAMTYPAGVLADRFHPLRVLLWAHGLHLILAPLGLIWLFCHPSSNVAFIGALCLALVMAPAQVVIDAMTLPLHMRLLPQDRYGQFASAQSLIRSVGTIVGGLLAGFFLDIMQKVSGGSDFGFRYYPVWILFWAALAFIFLRSLYYQWQKKQSA